MRKPTVCYFLTMAMGSLLLAGVAKAQEDPALKRLEESPRHHEWVEIAVNDQRKVKTFVVYPEVDAPATAVIVIHENRGLTDWVRSVADQLAEKGYVALAPDFLSGTAPEGGGTTDFSSSDAARDAIYKLPPEQVTADLDAVVKYAGELDATNEHVVVSGFCWGGGQSFRYGIHNPKIDAAFVFYGSAPGPEDLKQLKVPVYGFYGGNDFRITGQVPDVEKVLKEAGARFEPVVYEGAGHGFMRAGEAADASPANAQAMEQAWKRWHELLTKIGEKPKS